MAAKLPPRKKRALQEEASSDEECNSSDSSSVDSQLEVQVEFEARQIDEDDFHGIRKMLQQVFLKANVDLSGLTNLILAQKTVGSTIKICEDGSQEEEEEEEEGDVYGISTVINLTHHRIHACECVRQVVDFLLSQCRTHCASQHSRLAQLLQDDSRHVGLLLNERFLNIPPDIVPPLLQSLIAEMREVTKKGQPFDFNYYVVVVRSHVVSDTRLEAGKKRRKGKSNGATAVPKLEEPPVLDGFESELLQKESLLTFSYPVSEESDSVLGGLWSFDDKAMQPYRTVMIIPAGKLESTVAELETTLRNS